MSRRSNRPRKYFEFDAKHVRLYRTILKSPAWRTMPLAAKVLYIEGFELRYNGCNNGDIALGEREAAKTIGSTGRGQCTQKFAGKMIDILEERGFIRPNVKGRFYAKRHVTRWILTRYEFMGQKATVDFMRLDASRSESENQRSPKPLSEVPRTSRTVGSAPIEVPKISMLSHLPASIEVPRTSVLVYQGISPPTGSPRMKAAWLRAQLAAGTLCMGSVGAALGIGMADVEPIAAGTITLSKQQWERVAARAKLIWSKPTCREANSEEAADIRARFDEHHNVVALPRTRGATRP
jgi:hypothetical protein